MFFLTHETCNTRFLVAKYIRDMHRLEPRNIGVVVWTDGNVVARFLGESSDAEAKAPRKLGVRDQETYRQWIRYWREQMSRPELRLSNGNEQVPRESPQFLDALRDRSKQQFVLVDGGFLTGKIDPKDIDEVLHDLFAALVDDAPQDAERAEEESVLLRKAISRAFKDSGIESAIGYQTKIPLAFPVNNHTMSFTFDSGVYTTRPMALFQHAILTRPTTVNSAAFMFNCIQRSDFLPYRLKPDRCVALVRASQQVTQSPEAMSEIAKLEAFGTVVDLAEHDYAVNFLTGLAQELLTHG